MKRLVVSLLCCLPLATPAAIYKWVDEQGNVVYSDKPHPGAQELNLPPPSVYSPAPITTRTAVGTSSKRDAEDGYTEVAIVQPQQDETIRDNTGMVMVQVALQPALKTDAGHRLTLLVNGTPQPGSYVSTSLRITDLDRGTHTVQVRVIDAEGNTIAESNPVTFHLKQASRLHPRSNLPPRGAPSFPRPSIPPPAGGGSTSR